VFVLEVSIKLSYDISHAALSSIKNTKTKKAKCKTKELHKKIENKRQKVQKKAPQKK
jgi:hypothetical protein